MSKVLSSVVLGCGLVIRYEARLLQGVAIRARHTILCEGNHLKVLGRQSIYAWILLVGQQWH
jgi:hypothetical protein